MKTTTEYVDRETISPAFGDANNKTMTIRIRNDLSYGATLFIQEHELFHLRDSDGWWLWREIKANFVAAFKHPIGFIIIAFMSLSIERLKFYVSRFKESN